MEYINLYNPIELNKYIKSLIKDNDMYYIVIDEIQNVYDIINPVLTEGKIVKAKKNDEDRIGFVQVVLGLMKIKNVDLYITGSNSRFLSKDILTDFRDRGDEIHVLPLSFEEYANARRIDLEKAYEEYSLYGGMPRTLFYDDIKEKEKYISNLYHLTYTKDILDRHDESKYNELDSLTAVVASNVGSLINPNTIANTYKSEDKNPVNTQTIY
ncbi:MAG TPA: ATPase, partial [Firmicutes bacterium]|nr:ATPase [Bacillota bacterium]